MLDLSAPLAPELLELDTRLLTCSMTSISSDFTRMATRKKAKLDERAASQRRSTIRSKSRQRKGVTHFRFLDLSAELRNNVYDKIIEETCLVLPRNNSNRPLGLSSAFARVSKSVRSEFLPLALHTTPIIRTEVRNWDFGHVVNFMNRIGDDEMERLVREQRVIVNFSFSGDTANPSGLVRWLRRFEDDDKRGDGVTFDYICTNPKFSRQNWIMAGFRACTSGGPRGSEQFEKIEGVFGAWN